MTAELRYVLHGPPSRWKRTNEYRGRRITDARMREAKAAHAGVALAHRPKRWVRTGAFELEVRVFLSTERKGDADNYGKLVADALQGIAYENDQQIADTITRRRVDRVRPRTEVVLRRITLDEAA